MEVKLTEGGFKTNWARWHNFKKDNRSVSLVRAGSEHSQRLTHRGFKLPVPPENLSPTEKPHTLPAPPHTCRWSVSHSTTRQSWSTLGNQRQDEVVPEPKEFTVWCKDITGRHGKYSVTREGQCQEGLGMAGKTPGANLKKMSRNEAAEREKPRG